MGLEQSQVRHLENEKAVVALLLDAFSQEVATILVGTGEEILTWDEEVGEDAFFQVAYEIVQELLETLAQV